MIDLRYEFVVADPSDVHQQIKNQDIEIFGVSTRQDVKEGHTIVHIPEDLPDVHKSTIDAILEKAVRADPFESTLPILEDAETVEPR